MSQSSTSRDETLDVLRGLFILKMIISHLGTYTPLNAVASFENYSSAADGFVAVSGIVLGMISRPRLARGRVQETYRKHLSRAASLWAIHCALMLGLLALHEWTGVFGTVPPVGALGGWVSAAWRVLTLRLQSNEYMNILPIYVVFLLLTPLALEALRRNRFALFFVPAVLVYAATQANPDFLRLTDGRSGEQVFSLAAWQLVFFSGLYLGYHRDELLRRFGPERRRRALALCVAVFAILFAIAQLQRARFAPWHVLSPGQERFLFGREHFGIARFVYFWSGFCVLGLVVGALRARPAGEGLCRQIALMGQRSLSCFLAHLPLALAARALETSNWPILQQHLLCVAAVLAIYLLARLSARPRPGLVPGLS